jgi:signal transduction histidine kinase
MARSNGCSASEWDSNSSAATSTLGSAETLGELQQELDQALRELRELARGIHPAVLTDQGLSAAVRTLSQRAPILVTVTSVGERAPAHVETAAYFVVSEALVNVAKYARATRAIVDLVALEETLGLKPAGTCWFGVE